MTILYSTSDGGWCGVVCDWADITESLVDAGLTDVYRLAFPDATNFPGNTWTTFKSTEEVYDCIDMIYQNTTLNLTLRDIRTVAGNGHQPESPSSIYASDHYAA